MDGHAAVPGEEEDCLGLADIINSCLTSSAALVQEAQAEGVGTPVGELDPNYFAYMQTLMDLLCDPVDTEGSPTATAGADTTTTTASATATPAKSHRERTLSTGEFVGTPVAKADA